MIQKQINECRREVTQLPGWKTNPPHVCYFSDSLMLFYEDDKTTENTNALNKCIEDIKDILRIYLDADLPLRGGVAYGSISFGDNLLLGVPVLRAVHYESIIAIPLVVVPMLELERVKPHPHIVDYKAIDCTLKDGGVMFAIPIFPTSFQAFLRTAQTKYKHHRVYGPYQVAQVWKTALDHCVRYKHDTGE